jgi:predicted nucleotidyltransferase
MRNSSKVNLNNAGESTLNEVLMAVDDCCLTLMIDFYILGALARDIWFTKEMVPASGTKDVDFAVLLSEPNQFYQLKNLLIVKHGFVEHKDNALALLSPNTMQIDILPFGALEVEDGVAVDGKGPNKINVNGFKEVYLESIRSVYVVEGKQFKVATLPGIFLLKLIAYDDRPEHRGNDPVDCISILKNYFNLQGDLIYEFHSDLFGNDRSLELISARVIGREMKRPLDQNAALKDRLVAILKNHIQLKEKSSFILKMASFVYLGTEECVLFLEEILNGVLEESTVH